MENLCRIPGFFLKPQAAGRKRFVRRPGVIKSGLHGVLVVAPALLRFADLELDLRRYELRRGARVLKLERIPMDLLVFLVEERGRLVRREEIVERIWGKDVSLDTENAVNTAIRKVRRVLKDDPTFPHLIETVAGKGYRFIAPVTTDNEFVSAEAPPTTVQKPRKSNGFRLIPVAGALGATLLIGVGIWSWRHSRSFSPTISSLAVLPLQNLSGDPSQEYFSEGLTDELLTDLAKLPGLRVISRTSVMHYKGTNKPLPQIAQELKVDAIVEGTVARTESRVRIRVQLIEARTDHHLWAEAYERDMRDVLGLQSEVALAISHQINLELTPQQKTRFARSPSRNFEAYAAYLKGRYEWNKRTEESLNQSIRYFEEAITKDPSYALAHEGLAETYAVMNTYEVLPPEEAYPKAKAEALRALELDDGLGEAHAILAGVRMIDRDWQGAEVEYHRALELSPSSATAHQWYGEYLLNIGRFNQGLGEMQRAEELDPASPLASGLLGLALYEARKYDEAIQQLHKAIEMEPRFAWSHCWLGLAYEQKGMRREAVQEFQKAVDLSGGSPSFTAYLGYAYGLSGDRSQAIKIAAKLEILAQSKMPYVSPLCLALLYTGLDNKERTLYWVEKAYVAHDFLLPWAKVEPSLDSLRSAPQFQNLILQMRFP
jgi:TolB-like protein/DNA-binding winged helix-turn-helix (wHTH) protein/Tfp pilus assembly protein PilF